MHRPLALTLLVGLAATPATAARTARNGQISFWSDRGSEGRAQVFVMNADGSNQRRLTNLFSAKRGDFSPDGRKLVFDGRAYETLDDFDIFVMNADGTDVTRLTRGPERDTQAAWSPDGRLVSFVRDKSQGSAIPSLWIIGAEGSGAHRVARGGSAAWSPDDKRLAVGGLGLRIMNVDGTHARAIFAGETEVAAWSRDGRRILFTSFRDGNPEVYVMRASGKGVRRLTRNSADDYAADFSPDGRKILFSSKRTGYLQVYVMNLDGSGVRNISRSQSSDWATSWQALAP
jgi:TolB protein